MRFVMVSFLLGAVLGSATAEVLVVAPDGSGDYPTIQAAVDAASDGDEVVLLDGVFLGCGNRDIYFEEKTIVIRSASGDPTSCVIDCQGSADEWHWAIWFAMTDEETTLSEITVTGGYLPYGAGIRVGPEGSCTIRGCIFWGNTAEEDGAAIYTAVPGMVLIESCTVVGNTAPGGAIGADDWGHADIRNTIVAYTHGGPAVDCWTGNVTVSCSNFFENEGGDWDNSCVGDFLGVGGNISEDPLFCGWEEGNYYLQSDSPCAPGGECGLIGALPVGCEPSPVMESTWGGVKALYRHPATE